MNISNDTWFTYSAQIINFLILVWLLRHFLYRPVLNTIEKREQGFISREEKVSQAEAEATELLATYRQQMADLEGSREKMMGQVREEVTAWKGKQIEQAKTEVAVARERWHSAYQQERERILRTLKERLGKEVQETARILLRELASCKLEDVMIDVFLKRFAESPEGLSRFKSSAPSDRRLRIRSAFPVSDESQQRIIHLLNGQSDSDSGFDGACDLEVDPTLICGVELVYGDHRWSWSLAESLGELEQNLESLLSSGATQRLAGGTSA